MPKCLYATACKVIVFARIERMDSGCPLREGAGSGEEITGEGVLMVRNRRIAGCHPGDGGEQSLHVVVGGVDSGTGPDGSGDRPAIPSPCLVTVLADVLPGQAGEPGQVGDRGGEDSAAQPASERLFRTAPNLRRGLCPTARLRSCKDQ